MARAESDRQKGHPVGLAVLGGFVLGAATVLFLVWAYGAVGTGPAGPDRSVVSNRLPGEPAAVAPPAARPSTSAPPQEGPALSSPAAPVTTVPATPTIPPSSAHPAGSPPPTSPSPGTPGNTAADLLSRRLLIPVQGVRPEALAESFADARGGGSRAHEALDIPAPRDTPVLAVEDGKLAKLFTSRDGGLTVYQFDPSATYAYYYAHLDRYADGLKEGETIRRGQLLGYVGTTGNAPPNAPHLHFAIFQLTPEKQWWRGTALDPYPILRQSGLTQAAPIQPGR